MGDKLLDFIMFEHAVLGLKPATTAGTIWGIRYLHVAHGRPDFAFSGVRYKLLLKALTRKLPSVHKLLRNVDLLLWVRDNFWKKSHRSNKIKEIWAGQNLGFFCLMRAIELRQVIQKDVEIGLGIGRRKLTAFIYKSKTEESQRGFFRTLIETGEDICPVRSMISFLNSFGCDCESDGRSFSGDLEKHIRSVIKWIASQMDWIRRVSSRIRSEAEDRLLYMSVASAWVIFDVSADGLPTHPDETSTAITKFPSM